ncbi:hypothetical protein ANN_11711 [Periplaneta americana]|uniref:HAT C-terminal dimerisation domain-containing protein n=1 Tax=Periplaneta americana TaxID=6978 RepID=A0ABQ8T5U2_PERAM|nr:hypothetical protein ANN_11711 [Periplaneta americana]
MEFALFRVLMGEEISHEISASVWDRCSPSIVMYLGDFCSEPLDCTPYTSGRQHSLKCAKGTRCCPVCTVVQQGEIDSIPASSYGVHPSALRFPRTESRPHIVNSTELLSIVRSRNMFAFSSDERTFNIESYFRTAMFATTYVCEKLFSTMKIVKIKFRSRLTDKYLRDQLRLIWQECELFGNAYCRDMGRGLRRLLTYLLTLTSTVNMDTEHLICVVECYRTQPMITNTLRTTCRRKTQFERGYGSTQTVQTAICCYDVQVIPYTFSSSD